MLDFRLPTLVNGDEASLWPWAACEKTELSIGSVSDPVSTSPSRSVAVEGVTISGPRPRPGPDLNGNPAAGVRGAASVDGVVINEVGRDR